MSIEAWLAFTLISVANIVTPGPAILDTIRRAAQLGFKRCIPTGVANAAGLAVAGFACAFGVATFILASEWLWFIFRWAGVLCLVYLGLRLIAKRSILDRRRRKCLLYRQKRCSLRALRSPYQTPRLFCSTW